MLANLSTDLLISCYCVFKFYATMLFKISLFVFLILGMTLKKMYAYLHWLAE